MGGTDAGFHNSDLAKAASRLDRGNTYKDLSTVVVIPTRGMIPARVVQSWRSLLFPMNQKNFWLFKEGMEVGEAYDAAVRDILAHPELSKWKFLLTLEEDNCPPPDGLLRLFESIEKYDAVGGLYWTKGHEGQPMIYGDPREMPKNFVPQRPIPGTVQPCNGLGMGFTLFKVKVFKRMRPPYFRTVQEFDPSRGVRCYTQDLHAFEEMAKLGFKFASDNRVCVGHWAQDEQMMW